MDDIMQSVEALFNNMENFTQKDGLIGKPVTHSDKTFMPIISMTVGFGGGNSKTKSQVGQSNTGMNMGGGASGLGAKLCTDAILVIDKNNVMIAPVNPQGNMSQIIDKVPQIISNMTGQQQNGQQQGQQSQQQGSQQQNGQQQSGQQQSGQQQGGQQNQQNKQ